MIDTSPHQTQTLLLTTPSPTALRPLIESAIRNELRVVHMGIRRTQQRIADFESQYGMETSEFLRRYRNDEITETLETIEWLGETKMLARLYEDEATLREVRFVD